VRFDCFLNLLWLLLGLSALLAATCSSRKRLCLDIVGVALVIATLFPFISATDDMVQIEQTKTQQTGPNDNLIRLYQAMEAPLAVSAPRLFLTLAVIFLLVAPSVRGIQRSTPACSGRSPPALVPAL
jgi:hypothetical protein